MKARYRQRRNGIFARAFGASMAQLARAIRDAMACDEYR